MNNAYLSKTEFEIMQYLWNSDQEVSAREIRDHFSSKNWSKQAISTFLKRLADYNFIKIRKESITKYYYSAAMTEKDYNLLPAKDIVKKSYNGSFSAFVCDLFDSNEVISAEDIDRIQKKINELNSSQ